MIHILTEDIKITPGDYRIKSDASTTELSAFFENADSTWYSLVSLSEDVVIPWDAEPSVSGNNLELSGGAGPSGYGYCVVRLPLKDINGIVGIELYDPISDPDLAEVAANILEM